MVLFRRKRAVKALSPALFHSEPLMKACYLWVAEKEDFETGKMSEQKVLSAPEFGRKPDQLHDF